METIPAQASTTEDGDLRLSDVPPLGADWASIAAFALTYSGYARFDRPELLGEIANRAADAFLQNGALPASLAELRACLFFEQRRFHHLDVTPSEDQLTYIRALVGAIRDTVAHATGPAAGGTDLSETRPADNTTRELLRSFHQYRTTRTALLASIGCPASNRDPLAEFSERLVELLTGGMRAESRVQQGYDIIGPSSEHIQVKYLANPSGHWVNEHHVFFSDGVDRYDLVLFQNLRPVAVLSFPRAGLAAIAAKLRKRHAGTDRLLQLTQRNAAQLLAAPAEFEALGMRVIRLQEDTE